MKNIFSTLFVTAISLTSHAEVFQGKPQLNSGQLDDPAIYCLVRYGGTTSVKKHYPNSTVDREVRYFDKYLETGEHGQHGTMQLLKIVPEAPFSGVLRLTPFEFIETDFKLKFTVTDSGNTFIKKD